MIFIIPVYFVFHMLIGSAMGAPEDGPRNPPARPDYTSCVVAEQNLNQVCVAKIDAKEAK